MPLWLRIILIIALVFVMIAVAAGVIGYRWWMNNKGHLMEAAKHAQADGETFGQGKDALACVNEGLRQANQCEGFPCDLKGHLFLSGCWRTASRTQEYCAKLPERTSFIQRAQWMIDECSRRNQGSSERCRRFMQTVCATCDGEASK